MKKTLILATAALSIMSANANAATIDFAPYAGFDLSTSRLSLGRGNDNFIENNYNSFSIVGGIKTDKYVMLEGFLQRASKESYKTNIGKMTSNFYAFGADVLGYYPLYRDLDLIAGIGVGEYKFRYRHAGVKTSNDTGYGTRFTAGAQYNFDYNWGIRATYRHVKYSDSDVNNSNEYSIGVRYSF